MSGGSRSRNCRPASSRATAGSRRTRSTSTPNSPGASPKCSPTKATWSKRGRSLARMDTQDLEASLKKSEAQVRQAQQSLDEARANVEQQTTQVTLAQQQFDRTSSLVARGYATNELLDQRRQALNGAIAALNAAKDRVGEAERAIDAATHDAELYKVNIADNTLVAPRDGRIQYRIANIGEVLPAGGRVFTMLDIAYVYMDIYLPTTEAGKVKIGSDARIVLDAVPDVSIPAKVAFVATQAQFTPKTVETKDERDKLMFRIRVRIDPERLRARGEYVRSGLPGVAYVQIDPAVAWPAKLQGSVAEVIERQRPVARIEGVTQRYGGAVALEDVTIEIPAGRMVGFIGPDGVGKSSLLSLVAGARQIQSGSVFVLGGDMADAAHRAAVCPRIAYMPQGLGKNLYADLSVRENIEFFGRLFGQSRPSATQKIAELLESTGLAPVFRSAGEEAFGRHAAEARALLLSDPRSRPSDPRRADHRRRSALAPAVLGADRPHARAPRRA